MGLLDGTTQASYYQGSNLGNYQFISLEDIVNNFMVAYVGEDKIIPKVKRTDVAFHAKRALQELSYDTLKSIKAQEIELPPSLTMMLPQDYVNYVKLVWSDDSGIEHIIYPTSKTSNPTPIKQNDDGDYALTAVGTLTSASSTITLDNEYKNILVGMQVSSPNIPTGSVVESTSNASDITTITISNTATYTGDETLTFTPQDGSLVLEEESAHILENVTWTNGDNKITQSPNSDVSNIKVGMLVSHEDFDEGTTVIDVNGAVITASTNANDNSSSPDEITFLSNNIVSTTWTSYKDSSNQIAVDQLTTSTAAVDADDYFLTPGQRYGLDPQYSQANGSFYIDENAGKIHFSSNISGKNVILKYISDGLGTDAEMVVHKFAEEAMYKWIAHAILATRINVQEYLVTRFKKERFAEIRKAKIRLSNLKIEEITQVLRGKSKQIKH